MTSAKNILLISPQPWGKLHVSKHHYAIAAADMGHKVYFLGPPVKNDLSFRIEDTEYKNIYLVNGGFRDSLVMRYHLKRLYKWRVRSWIRKVLKKLPAMDIVWCFETNIIDDLRPFGNAAKIFHVVDPVNPETVDTARTADMLVCVSTRILDQFAPASVPVKKVINHALSATTIQQAINLDLKYYKQVGPVKVGYVGNLYRKIIDTDLVIQLIRDNPSVEFHFWGPGTSNEKNNLGGETASLAQNLGEFPNVLLHRSVPSNELIKKISNMDVFILAYKKIMPHYDASNSHKLLEYLATGKMVVTSYLDEYNRSEFSDAMKMSPDEHNEELPSIFSGVIGNIQHWNDHEKMEARRSFAIRHTYKNNTLDILNSLNQAHTE